VGGNAQYAYRFVTTMGREGNTGNIQMAMGSGVGLNDPEINDRRQSSKKGCPWSESSNWRLLVFFSRKPYTEKA
jgi:hypothetical protein